MDLAFLAIMGSFVVFMSPVSMNHFLIFMFSALIRCVCVVGIFSGMCPIIVLISFDVEMLVSVVIQTTIVSHVTDVSPIGVSMMTLFPFSFPVTPLHWMLCVVNIHPEPSLVCHPYTTQPKGLLYHHKIIKFAKKCASGLHIKQQMLQGIGIFLLRLNYQECNTK